MPSMLEVVRLAQRPGRRPSWSTQGTPAVWAALLSSSHFAWLPVGAACDLRSVPLVEMVQKAMAAFPWRTEARGCVPAVVVTPKLVPQRQHMCVQVVVVIATMQEGLPRPVAWTVASM